jgi:prepilin-type N-terminal cleavage/methylation domain-containing protein
MPNKFSDFRTTDAGGMINERRGMRDEGRKTTGNPSSVLCRPSSGFTLLELLAAMSITAITAVTALSLFSKGVDIWENVTFRGSSEHEAALFLEEFEKDLKNCVNFSEIQFLGDTETVDFPAIINKNSGSSSEAIGRIKYSFDKDKMAVYKRKAVYPNCAQENLFMPYKILGSVESLSFEYAALNAHGALNWTGLWQDKQIKPKGVRVRIKIAANEGSEKTHNFERVVYIPIG